MAALGYSLANEKLHLIKVFITCYNALDFFLLSLFWKEMKSRKSDMKWSNKCIAHYLSSLNVNVAWLKMPRDNYNSHYEKKSPG